MSTAKIVTQEKDTKVLIKYHNSSKKNTTNNHAKEKLSINITLNLATSINPTPKNRTHSNNPIKYLGSASAMTYFQML